MTAQRTNSAPRLHGKTRGDPRAHCLARTEQQAERPLHLIVDDEDDERRGREHEHDEILHRVRADQVVAGAEHEAREQEQSDADLDEAAVDADREEQRHFDEQARLARRGMRGDPAFRFEQHDAEQHQHQHADRLAQQRLVEIDGELGADDSADDGRHDELPRARERQRAAPAKRRDGDDVLQQHADAVRAVRDVRRQARARSAAAASATSRCRRAY